MAEKEIEDLKRPLFDPSKTAQVLELVGQFENGLTKLEAKTKMDAILARFQTAGESAKGADPGWIAGGGEAEGVIGAVKQKVADMEAQASRTRSPKEPAALGVIRQVESAVNCHYTHVAAHVVKTLTGATTEPFQPPEAKEVEQAMQAGTSGEHDVMGDPMRQPHTRTSTYKGRPPSGGSGGGRRGGPG